MKVYRAYQITTGNLRLFSIQERGIANVFRFSDFIRAFDGENDTDLQIIRQHSIFFARNSSPHNMYHLLKMCPFINDAQILLVITFPIVQESLEARVEKQRGVPLFCGMFSVFCRTVITGADHRSECPPPLPLPSRHSFPLFSKGRGEFHCPTPLGKQLSTEKNNKINIQMLINISGFTSLCWARQNLSERRAWY